MTRADAVPAGLASRKRGARAATGLHSQALRPAARSWLTGVAGPRSRKRGPCAVLTPLWRAVRRPHVSREACGSGYQSAPHRRATPSVLYRGKDSPDPRSGRGREGRLTRGRSNKTGNHARHRRSGFGSCRSRPGMVDCCDNQIRRAAARRTSPLILPKAGIQRRLGFGRIAPNRMFIQVDGPDLCYPPAPAVRYPPCD